MGTDTTLIFTLYTLNEVSSLLLYSWKNPMISVFFKMLFAIIFATKNFHIDGVTGSSPVQTTTPYWKSPTGNGRVLSFMEV